MSTKDIGLIGLVEVPKKQVQLLLESGYFYMEKGLFKEAETVFQGCMSLLPKSEVPRIGMGHLYMTQDRLDQAIASYQSAIKVKPSSAEAHAFLGEAYLFKGKPNLALPALQKAEQLDTNDPPVTADLARSLLQAHKEGIFGH